MMTICVPVPGAGELRLGAVSLPAGQLLRLEDGTGVGWITQAPVRVPGSAWSALSALHGETGLIPVLVPAGRGDDLEASCYDLWIDSLPESWQTGPEWSEENEHADEMTAPFSRPYPGLAPAVTRSLPAGPLAAVLRSFPASRVALVPAARPADVLPVLNWCPGNWNCAFPAPSPAGFAAVLHSWEERFGARLLALTHDEAYLLVERPPYDLDTALPVAAEHFVFCDEPAGRQSVQTTAAQIIDAPVWYFRWD